MYTRNFNLLEGMDGMLEHDCNRAVVVIVQQV